MKRYRAILASTLALAGLVVGLGVEGSGCANGGADPGNPGDDGGDVGDVSLHDGGEAGGEGSTPCPVNQTRCGAACTDLVTDGKNCGKCGNACGSGEVCSGAACSFSCSPPETLCGGPPEAGAPSEGGGSGDDGSSPEAAASDAAGSGLDSGGTGGDGGSTQPYCANLGTDDNNCGTCGNVCPPNHTCNTANGSSLCGLKCGPGQQACIAGDICIQPPPAQCCSSADCTVPGQICPQPGGTCQCPGGETFCTASNSCISSSECCTTADCTALAGATCPMPGQACQCANGEKACLSTKTCVAPTACCTAAGACCADPLGKSCGAASVQAALTVGGAAVTATGLSTATGEEDWVQVTFNGESNLAFHGHILFTANPNGEFVFDIASDCKGTLRACGEGGTCKAKTEWEEKYITTAPLPDPASAGFKPIPAVGVTYIRVYRAGTTAAPTCDSWALSISE